MLVLFIYLRQNSHRYNFGNLQDHKINKSFTTDARTPRDQVTPDPRLVNVADRILSFDYGWWLTLIIKYLDFSRWSNNWGHCKLKFAKMDEKPNQTLIFEERKGKELYLNV